MARRKLTITLDVASIDNAIKTLQSEKEWRKRKIAELIKALAEVGAEETGYGGMVSVEETDGGCRIVARDEQIAFIEFGAGDTAMVLSNVDGIDIYPGSWSSSNLGKGLYAAKGYWYYRGEKMTEIQPQRGMLRAEETIIAKVREVAERVFSDG